MMIDIVGIYNYDNTIFDLLSLPVAADKQLCIETILMKNAELPVVYSSPQYLKNIIGIWSRGSSYKWQTLWDSTQQEYNPIENYDRMEEWQETEGESRQINDEVTATNTATGKAQQQDKVKGFESGALTDKRQMDSTEETAVDSKTNTNGIVESDRTGTRSGRAHGNIGVTTTQQMLEQERKIADFSFYEMVAQSFKETFCVMVY